MKKMNKSLYEWFTKEILPHLETLGWEYDRMSQDGKDAFDAILWRCGKLKSEEEGEETP